MRAFFLSVIIFFLVGNLTASTAITLMTHTEEANYIEKGQTAIHLPFSGTPGKKDHIKRKAAIGLIACITLGPVGYLGVHLFSHKNPLVLKRAKLGLMILIGLAAIALIILLIAMSKDSGFGSGARSGRGSGSKNNSWQGPNLDFPGGTNGKKHKAEELNPQPSAIWESSDHKFY
jgi:hypothetical protein